MSELKPCPFCGKTDELDIHDGKTIGCNRCTETNENWGDYITNWELRPVEDKLQARITELEGNLHDAIGQLEIATDLGNKRWLALNDIYENGEKHNSNWCKRKAQEGLGIK